MNHEFVESLKKKTIEDIVKLKISPKINKDENINKHIYDTVVKKLPIIIFVRNAKHFHILILLTKIQ